MDEARLKEIEDLILDENRIPSYIGTELIAALRDAWRERDGWKRDCLLERDEFHKSLHRIAGIDEVIARAARAEAEVERLKTDNLGLQGAYSTCARENGEIKLILESQNLRLHRYHAVCEAAEDVRHEFNGRVRMQDKDGYPDPAGKAFDKLRRALDAVQDPAR